MNKSTTRAAAPLGLWLACLLCLGAAAPVAQAQLATPTRTSPTHQAVNVPTTVELRWQPVGGAVGYEWRLLRNGSIARSGSLQGMNATQVTLQNLNAGETYGWRVRALANRERNHSRWSNAWRFTTISTVTLLTPADRAVNVSMPVTFSWTPLNGVSRYEVQTSTRQSFAGQAASATSHTSLQLQLAGTGNRTYYWRVRAIRGKTTLPWTQARSFVTAASTLPPPDIQPPPDVAPPTIHPEPPKLSRPASGAGVAAVNAMTMRLIPVQFGWDLRGAKRPFTCHFELYRGAGIGAGPRVHAQTVSGTSLALSVEPLRQYTWRVGLQVANGQILWSDPRAFTALGAVVAGRRELFDGRSLFPPPWTWRQATLLWQPHPGATAYEVEIVSRGFPVGGVKTSGTGSGNASGGSVIVEIGPGFRPDPMTGRILHRYRTSATSLTINWPQASRPAWRIRAVGEGNMFGPWSELRNLYY